MIKETELPEVIIGNPSLLQIGFSIMGFLFPSSIIFLICSSDWITRNDTETNLIWIIVSIFAFFALGSLFMLFSSKKVTLTNTELTISYPLIFYKRNIDFDDVYKVRETKYNIQGSQNFSTYDIYNGNKIIIELYNSKKIIVTSMEITNYTILAKNLKNITTSYFKLKSNYTNLKNSQGYGWLIFIIVLTFSLLFSLIQKKYFL
ncbi:hypothetical protein [Flavobacterium hibernum]|uniref:Uncharacterized protein n=1 Tax=Flavobacterium hibernum TaxID=37752 RepID=A0A0D0F3Q0_9FLAO|nr:hypothetical protein [Flavobacterium hibernum]KIO54256.1 hypothetical protein IW18_02020 [Flavobacterium hibernum]OXA85383.1 hypothetical protein B0A73_16710 [Flavobacterium hibernum]STO10913.1 Uncharacterised protein [Flavobacterium hibernum]